MFYFTQLYHGPNKLHLRGTLLDVVSLPPTSLADLLGALLDEVALVSANKTLAVLRARRPPRIMRIGVVASLMLLRCSAPDQAFLVRRLERCASRLVTRPRRPSPVAAGAVPCTTWDMVIISDSSFALRSPIAVFRPTLTPPCYMLSFFRSLGR